MRRELNTQGDALMMKMQTLTILIPETLNSTKNWNVFMESIRQKSNKIWKEERLCRHECNEIQYIEVIYMYV